MTLQEFFVGKPKGSMIAMARQLGVSKTWFSLICHERAKPSEDICVNIERLTKGKVKRVELRPDLFGKLERK